jgi:hemerythrin-like domain-containing protein
MSARPALERLFREHDDIAQVLVLLDSELASVAFAEDPDDALAASALAYLGVLVEGFHHVKEDRACEAAAARVPALRELLAETVVRHAQVRDSGAAARAAFDAALFDLPVARRDLAEAGFAYSAIIRLNVELEEQRVIPKLAEVLDDGDWARIEAEVERSAPPLLGGTGHASYEQLFQELERRFGVDADEGHPATPR